MNEAAFNVALKLVRFGPATVGRSVAIVPWSNLEASPRLEREEQRQQPVLVGAAGPAKVEPVQVMEAGEGASLREVCPQEVEHPSVAILWALQPWAGDQKAPKASAQALATAQSTVRGPLEFRPR
jgi:hypothetical protein